MNIILWGQINIMRIVFTRSNPILPDPRVEKEANSLLKFGHKVMALGWNRNLKINKKYSQINLENGHMPIRWFNIKAEYGRGISNLLPIVRFQFMLIGWLFKHHKKYDCIHACDFDTVLPAWIASKLFRKKLIYDIFDYYVDTFRVPKRIKPFIKLIDTKIINSADSVIITNESRLKQISNSKPKRLVIIHNSPKLNYSLKINGGPGQKNSHKFAFVGTLSKNRLINEILDVFINTPKWELHIGGFGLLEEEVKWASKQYSNIYYYGRVSYDEVLKIESDCNILFAVYNPSESNHKYSSPNKLYEAMMLGKPIIVAKGTGIDVLVKQNGIGKVIDYSGNEFKKAAEELLADKDNFDSISKKGQRLYKEHFSWDIMEQRLRQLYDSLDKRKELSEL